MFSKWLPKGIHFFLNPPFFVSMATAAKCVQPIPIFLAYLVPLDVEVVSIDNRHRFWNLEPWGAVMSAIALQWQF
jgi:hypothetical protein